MIIDLSYYNKVTNWHDVKSSVEGVILRMGYSGYASGKQVIDKKYYDNLAACQQLKIPVGVYFFPQSITHKEAEQEAAFILNNLPDEYPLGVWLDSEIADVKTKKGRADSLNVYKRTQFLLIIINILRAQGVDCGVYASKSWLEHQLDVPALGDVPIWVAQYNKQCTYKGTYKLWQYTSKASVPGISGGVDASVKSIEDNEPVHKYDEELLSAADVFANRVIRGDFGQGHEVRKNSIYELIRKRVNDIL